MVTGPSMKSKTRQQCPCDWAHTTEITAVEDGMVKDTAIDPGDPDTASSSADVGVAADETCHRETADPPTITVSASRRDDDDDDDVAGESDRNINKGEHAADNDEVDGGGYGNMKTGGDESDEGDSTSMGSTGSPSSSSSNNGETSSIKTRLTQGAWLVLVMFCAQEILTAGLASSFGVMYREPLKEFNTSAAFKSWVFNVGRGLASMAGFLAGPLSSAFGHRLAVIGLLMGPIGLTISSFATTPYIYFLSHTTLVSMGFGFSHYVLYLHMQKTFNKRRGLATGVFAAFRALSSALMPLLATFLSAEVGYANMMRIMAAMATAAVLFASVQTYKDRFKPGNLEAFRRMVQMPNIASTIALPNCVIDRNQDEEKGRIALRDLMEGRKDHQIVAQPGKGQPQQPKNNVNMILCSSPAAWARRVASKITTLATKLRKSMDFTVLKEPSFIIFTSIDCVLSLTTTNVNLALPFYAEERKFSNWVGASFLTTLAASEVVGGFLIPPLFDVKRINYLYIFCGLQFLASGLFVAVGFHVSQTWMFVICAAFGLVRAGTGGMSNVFIIKELTIDRFPSALSAKVLFKFGIFCIGPVTGHLVDVTGSYSTCFFAFAGMMAVGGTLTLLLPLLRAVRNKNGHDVNV